MTKAIVIGALLLVGMLVAYPLLADIGSVRPQGTSTNDLDAVVALSTSCTQVAAQNNVRTSLSVQNLGTVVVYCSKNAACSNAPASVMVALKASTAPNDGTGGVVSMTGWSGAYYCVATSGTPNVLVGAY